MRESYEKIIYFNDFNSLQIYLCISFKDYALFEREDRFAK